MAAPDGQQTSIQVIRAGEGAMHNLRHGRGQIENIVAPTDGVGSMVLERVTIDPGTDPGPYHLHRNAGNVYLAVAGQVEVKVASAIVTLNPADAVIVPAGIGHATHNATTQPAVLLALYDRSVAEDFEVVDEPPEFRKVTDGGD